ncbi:NtaA/DmoA family FMN-dependent monooxygenase [Humitalea sp. 24SJ18S-53]|uniref:NtaA/DmoA family FMN-dependent monooxygenase n=1 Tax=Humitalea sp. 24SJ18S-53 TaxID=3422307 RepID=UPI003D66C43D
MPRKHIRLGFSIWATGFHPAGWRLPDARADSTFDPVFLKRTAQLSEAAKLDFYFIGDRVVGLPEQQTEHPNLVLRPEAFTLAGYIAAVTEKIGIVATVNTTYAHPFNVARASATLDHLSGGRLALNVVTGRDPEAAQNFGRDEHWQTDRRFDTATEFTEVVHQLWDSWEDGALVAEKDGGRFLDPDRVHRIDYRGEEFQVRGPLNIVRPPQGQVPILTAGQSERSREYGAKYADIRFGHALQLNKARAYYAEVKGRLTKYGRSADSQSLVCGIAYYVGETKAEGHAIYRRVQELTVAPPNLAPLSTALGADLSGERPDAWIGEVAALAKLDPDAARIVEQAKLSYGDDRITLLDLFRTFRRTNGGAEVVGGPKEVADYFETWFEERAADGFILFPPYLPGSLENFTRFVVPELQRRGLFRTEYEGSTFRSHFNLPWPTNRHTVARAAAAVLETA